MDRLKNPALWCALIVAACAALIHGGIWPDGSNAIKYLTVASEIVGVAGIAGNGQRELEEVLMTHEAIAMVAVIGVPPTTMRRGTTAAWPSQRAP